MSGPWKENLGLQVHVSRHLCVSVSPSDLEYSYKQKMANEEKNVACSSGWRLNIIFECSNQIRSWRFRVDLWKSASHTNSLLNNKPLELDANFARTLPSTTIPMMEPGMDLAQNSCPDDVLNFSQSWMTNASLLVMQSFGIQNVSFTQLKDLSHIPCRAEVMILVVYVPWRAFLNNRNGEQIKIQIPVIHSQLSGS